MIARLSKTGLKRGRIAAYEAFACEISLPMFRNQDGFLGCVMSHHADQGLVLTFWRDEAAVEALKHSPSYLATVERILDDQHHPVGASFSPGRHWRRS